MCGKNEKRRHNAASVFSVIQEDVLFVIGIIAFLIIYALLILRKGTFVPYLVEPVHQLQLVVR